MWCCWKSQGNGKALLEIVGMAGKRALPYRSGTISIHINVSKNGCRLEGGKKSSALLGCHKYLHLCSLLYNVECTWISFLMLQHCCLSPYLWTKAHGSWFLVQSNSPVTRSVPCTKEDSEPLWLGCMQYLQCGLIHRAVGVVQYKYACHKMHCNVLLKCF